MPTKHSIRRNTVVEIVYGYNSFAGEFIKYGQYKQRLMYGSLVSVYITSKIEYKLTLDNKRLLFKPV